MIDSYVNVMSKIMSLTFLVQFGVSGELLCSSVYLLSREVRKSNLQIAVFYLYYSWLNNEHAYRVYITETDLIMSSVM